MKERGILFSGEMVRALLDGRKTQTRRTMKPQPQELPGDGCGRLLFQSRKIRSNVPDNAVGRETAACLYAPYAVGDILWVRETWGIGGARLVDPCLNYRADGLQRPLFPAAFPPEQAEFIVRVPDGWRPSIFMPRWASRITLEVTAVRAERLQDITPQDAAAEGVTFEQHHDLHHGGLHPCDETRAHWAFVNLWDRINGPGSWEANPWVWVYGLKRQ